jgi:hypothetical protein
MKVHLQGVLSLFALSLSLPQGAAQERLVVRAGRIHLSGQQILTRGSLLIEKGHIQDVAERSGKPGDLPFDSMTTNKLVYEGAVVTPAFIDIHCLPPDLLKTGELRERNFAMTPAWNASRAYDPFAPRWKALLRRGVTTIALAPDDGNLAGGSASWIQPGPNSFSPEGEAYLKLSLTTAVLNRERKPTSLLGAVDILRNTIVEAKNPLNIGSNPQLGIFASALNGGRVVGVACRSLPQIQGALDLFQEGKLEGFLIHGNEAALALPRIKDLEIGIVLDPLSPASTKKALALPQKLAKAKIPFAFSGEGFDKTGLPRFGFTLWTAVRQGLSPKQALAALTSVPASFLKIQDQVGSLLKGRRADLCIWSGNPWDLRSKLLCVVRSGKIVWKAKNPKENPKKNPEKGGK